MFGSRPKISSFTSFPYFLSLIIPAFEAHLDLFVNSLFSSKKLRNITYVISRENIKLLTWFKNLHFLLFLAWVSRSVPKARLRGWKQVTSCTSEAVPICKSSCFFASRNHSGEIPWSLRIAHNVWTISTRFQLVCGLISAEACSVIVEGIEKL